MAGPNMTRNESLAGQSVKQGNYTVTYNDRGYATKAIQDGGKSATSTVQTTHANDSAAHQEAYQAAQRGDWDAVGVAINKVGMQTPNKYGGYDMGAANQYMQELQDQFKYNANDYYQGKYDSVYGEGAWDGGTGTGQPTYNDYSDALVQAYKQNAQQYGEGTDAAAAAQQALAQQMASQQAAVNKQASLQEIGIMTGGSSGGSSAGGYSDMTKYLEDMYAQNLEAELAALKSAYDANVAELESQNDKIAEQYRAARNQEARQNELERLRMNEYALAQGLNTGTSGQLALAQNMAYQGNLGNLWAQEAQTAADRNLALAQLLADYNSNVRQTAANINAKKNAALYDERVRQQELAAKQQAATREDVLTLIAGGVTPDASMLAAAGMSENEALLWQALANGGTATTGASAPVTQQAAQPQPRTGGGYNNGGLTSEQIKALQNFYGTPADGLWGANSTSAAGGLTAAQAWEQFLGGGLKAIEQEVGMNRTSNGQATAIQSAYDNGRITEDQAMELLNKFGLL